MQEPTGVAVAALQLAVAQPLSSWVGLLVPRSTESAVVLLGGKLSHPYSGQPMARNLAVATLNKGKRLPAHGARKDAFG